MYKWQGIFLLYMACLPINNWAMDKISSKSSRPDKRFSSSDGQSQKIFRAIESYHHDAITSFIEKKPSLVNVYAYHKEFRCKVAPLHLAVKLNNIMAVELLLRLHANPNACVKEKNNSPLHMALSVEVTELLVKHGAWINMRNSDGKTPLMKAYAGKHSPLFSIAGYLLGQGADGNIQYTDGSEFLLHNIVRKRKKYAIQQLLEHGVNIECSNNKGETPLDIALEAFSTDESRSDIMGKTTSLDYFKKGDVLFYPFDLLPYQCPYRLLTNNADGFRKLNPTSEKARQAENILTELFIALHRGRAQKSWQAIRTNKKGHCFNRASFTDLKKWVGKDAVKGMQNYIDARYGMVYSETYFKDNKRTYYIVQKEIVKKYPFLFAYTVANLNFLLFSLFINCGNITDVEWVLSHIAYNLNGQDDDGDTLLHNAISSNFKPGVIELLMKYGIDYTVVNNHQCTAYELTQIRGLESHENAFIKGFFERFSTTPCSEIKKIVDKGLPVNIQHPETKVPLLLEATFSGSFEKCYFLLKKGANINVQGYNSDGKKYSPLLWAVLHNNLNLIALFLKYKALVTKEMLEHVRQESVCDGIRKLLQDAYDAYKKQKKS